MNTSTKAPLGTEQEELNGVASAEAYNFPTASGIDSLYYFIESNKAYEEFFHFSIYSVIEQSKEEHGGHIPKETLKITLFDCELIYLGKDKGFYFFADDLGLFRIGFKDPQTNRGVHDIRVQLQGLGIYAMGLIQLTEYINDVFLKEITTSNYFITRADLNIFVQYDVGSVIIPEHIVTRKRRFTRVIGKKRTYETLYVGKPPAMLRIYNKALEMDLTTQKGMILNHHLKHFGINTIENFWNIEFECHRDFLKQYHISTLDDLLCNAESLFHKMMEQIRFVDIRTISPKDVEANRLYKAPNHPLWDYLDHAYRFNKKEQSCVPLERIKYTPKALTVNDFLDEFRDLAVKYAKQMVIVHYHDVREILHESNLWLTPKAKKAVKQFIPIELQTDDRKYLLTRNFVAVPTLPARLEFISDDELLLLNNLHLKALHQECAKEDQDLSLIVKNTKRLDAEKERRAKAPKELDLWQQ